MQPHHQLPQQVHVQHQQLQLSGHPRHMQQGQPQSVPSSQPPPQEAVAQQQLLMHPSQASAPPDLQQPRAGGPEMGGGPTAQPLTQEELREVIYQCVLDLTSSSRREAALKELSNRREAFDDIAPLLWHSFGTMAAILQEIVAVYPMLSPPSLTAAASGRVCNALALLQCVASHPETRQLLLSAHIPLFLYPFLNTVSKTRPFEYLRLTSLGVVGALVKIDDPSVVSFLLQTEIIPLCLRIMETGSELSKTVATFIVQKVLLDDGGLAYICATAERFYAVSTVLCNMVGAARGAEPSGGRLLKHVVRCYLRLADNSRAREALRQCLPEALKDPSFHASLKDDPSTKKWLAQLLYAVADTQQQTPQGESPSQPSQTGALLSGGHSTAGPQTQNAGAGAGAASSSESP